MSRGLRCACHGNLMVRKQWLASDIFGALS
jgi:hypothetical protein